MHLPRAVGGAAHALPESGEENDEQRAPDDDEAEALEVLAIHVRGRDERQDHQDEREERDEVPAALEVLSTARMGVVVSCSKTTGNASAASLPSAARWSANPWQRSCARAPRYGRPRSLAPLGHPDHASSGSFLTLFFFLSVRTVRYTTDTDRRSGVVYSTMFLVRYILSTVPVTSPILRFVGTLGPAMSGRKEPLHGTFICTFCVLLSDRLKQK
jgi:hypothetical protein